MEDKELKFSKGKYLKQRNIARDERDSAREERDSARGERDSARGERDSARVESEELQQIMSFLKNSLLRPFLMI